MKIEINEQPIDKPDFPSFWKDKVDNIWLWSNEHSYVCFDKDGDIEIDVSCDRYDFEFDELNDIWEFVRINGTITITV